MNIENLPLTIKRIEQRKAERMSKEVATVARRLRIAELEYEIARVALLRLTAEADENRFSGSQSGDIGEGMGHGVHIPRIAIGD